MTCVDGDGIIRFFVDSIGSQIIISISGKYFDTYFIFVGQKSLSFKLCKSSLYSRIQIAGQKYLYFGIGKNHGPHISSISDNTTKFAIDFLPLNKDFSYSLHASDFECIHSKASVSYFFFYIFAIEDYVIVFGCVIVFKLQVNRFHHSDFFFITGV